MLVVLAVRLPRIAWKYEGIAYRLALLDAGVVLQSLYLVVTDLGLAGAAVGASDPELFAQASGIESWEETCVAAFGFGRPRVSLLGLEDNAGAAQALEAAIATDPAGLASLAIGLTLVRLGRPAAAVDYLRQAQALQADVGSSRKMVEDILRASALLATGSTSISTADQAEVYQQLGTTLRTLGYFDDASRALNEALMLRPGMPAATAALDSLVDIAKAPDSFVPKEASATALPELAADRLSQYLALFADRRTLGKSRYNPNSEIKSGKVVLWCIVPKYRVQWPGTGALSSASGDGGGCLVLALRANCESGFPQMAVNSYSSVPRSASSALKGSCFSSKAMSRSEIAKAAGLIGAASGAVLTRRRKPSAELKPVEPQRRLQPSLKNRSRCCGFSFDQPYIVASTRSMRRICVPFEKRIGENEKRKYAEGARLRGPREGAFPPKDPRNQWAMVGPSLPALRRGISLSRADRQPDLSYGSRTPRQGCNCMFFLTSFCWERSVCASVRAYRR